MQDYIRLVNYQDMLQETQSLSVDRRKPGKEASSPVRIAVRSLLAVCAIGVYGCSASMPGKPWEVEHVVLVHDGRYCADWDHKPEESAATNASDEGKLPFQPFETFGQWVSSSRPLEDLRNDLKGVREGKPGLVLVLPIERVDRSAMQEIEQTLRKAGYTVLSSEKPLPVLWQGR